MLADGDLAAELYEAYLKRQKNDAANAYSEVVRVDAWPEGPKWRITMAKRHKPEKVIAELRQVEVMTSQGRRHVCADQWNKTSPCMLARFSSSMHLETEPDRFGYPVTPPNTELL